LPQCGGDSGAKKRAGSAAPPAADHIQILAVTACPTGIAHTFMAAESIEQHVAWSQATGFDANSTFTVAG